ncbi:hypothetical protein ACFLQR_05525 [Verrucomicrobiota bacterium]
MDKIEHPTSNIQRPTSNLLTGEWILILRIAGKGASELTAGENGGAVSTISQ